MIDYPTIIEHFYPEDTALRRLLLLHSSQVRDKALALLATPKVQALGLSRDVVEAGAMLHDIGIGRCHAPSILCEGAAPYLAHGAIGAEMLRGYGDAFGIDLETYARICERHTGSGITAAEIREGNLPMEERDYLPETPEEKLVCYADKFFSKSGDGGEKPLWVVRKSMEKFGAGPLERFEALQELFEE